MTCHCLYSQPLSPLSSLILSLSMVHHWPLDIDQYQSGLVSTSLTLGINVSAFPALNTTSGVQIHALASGSGT
jgi:hypothetical protein